MLKFSFPKNLVPPGGYRANMPDGHTVTAADRNVWFSEIKAHYKRNSLTLPDGWQEYYEDQLCSILPPGHCLNSSGMPANTQDIRIGIEDLKHGMQVLWNITRHPDPLVSKELATQRAGICASCPANISVPGCKPCIQLANTVMDVKGKGETSVDSYLRVCAVCKCSNEAQVWVKKEILMTGSNGEQLQRMRELNPKCWKADMDAP